MGLTKHLHISNWVSLDWRLCENGGNSKPLIFFTSRSISAGHRVWNAAEHFETGSVFCVQNMTGTSHLKGLLSPGRLLTWRFTRERLVLIQYKYWVLHNTCNIITLIFIKDKQSLASKNTCVYICSSERASVRFVPRSRRISMLHGCIWIIFKALRRVQIYIKRWKCIPPREACDKKPYWNSMREIFLFFSFFPCEDQKWVMGLWESISQTIVFLMPRILTAPIIQSKGKRTLYPWDGGGVEMFGQDGAACGSAGGEWRRRLKDERLPGFLNGDLNGALPFRTPLPLMHRRGQGSRAHVSHLDSFTLLFQQWDTHAAVPAVGPQTHPSRRASRFF